MKRECPECGGRIDRPGLFGCDREPHPRPDLPQRIAAAIERDLDDRRGMTRLITLDDDVATEIRDKWRAIIADIIANT
jgi:hypothetical protein